MADAVLFSKSLHFYKMTKAKCRIIDNCDFSSASVPEYMLGAWNMAPVPQSSGRAEGKASLLASVGVRQAWEMVFPYPSGSLLCACRRPPGWCRSWFWAPLQSRLIWKFFTHRYNCMFRIKYILCYFKSTLCHMIKSSVKCVELDLASLVRMPLKPDRQQSWASASPQALQGPVSVCTWAGDVSSRRTVWPAVTDLRCCFVFVSLCLGPVKLSQQVLKAGVTISTCLFIVRLEGVYL